jgi:hypothetical protein
MRPPRKFYNGITVFFKLSRKIFLLFPQKNLFFLGFFGELPPGGGTGLDYRTPLCSSERNFL